MRVSKNKAIAAIFTMALATGTLFGCSQSDQAASDNQSSQSQNTASETQGEPQDRTIADMRGDEVLVPAEADTVMTVNSVATQMVLMLGGEDAAATMGRGFDYSEGSLNQAMFPGLAGKPTITGTDVTVENVAAIDPGIVLNGDDDTIEALRGAGIPDVRIERIGGSLTDHYSPGERVLRLSDSVYGSTSVAAIGVAAHECGHAIQHKVGYFPLKLRSLSVPIANIGSKLYWPVILLGLILSYMQLVQIGVLLFVFVVLFQLITLPVEFNASGRALRILEERGILAGDELKGAEKVLRAAAMTYVASLFSSILQLLRLVLLTRRDNRRR